MTVQTSYLNDFYIDSFRSHFNIAEPPQFWRRSIAVGSGTDEPQEVWGLIQAPDNFPAEVKVVEISLSLSKHVMSAFSDVFREAFPRRVILRRLSTKGGYQWVSFTPLILLFLQLFTLIIYYPKGLPFLNLTFAILSGIVFINLLISSIEISFSQISRIFAFKSSKV